MTNQRYSRPMIAARRALCAIAAIACSAPAAADPSAMFLQYELAHGRGRVEHTLSLAWAPPPDVTGANDAHAAPADLRLPLFTTAAGRPALFNAAPQSDEPAEPSHFGQAVLAVLLVAAAVASVASSVEKATDDILDDYELPPITLPPPPQAPPAPGGG